MSRIIKRDQAKVAQGKVIFADLLAKGTIWIDTPDIGTVYIGRAFDGVEVQVGHTVDMDGMYEYLADHPTPDTW